MVTFVQRADLPPIQSTTANALPALATDVAQTTSSEVVTTPSMYVSLPTNNPYVIKQTNPSGTVFIAVGAIVGLIFLGFILYNLIVSITASRTAKKNNANDKKIYEKYQNNHTSAYGPTVSNSKLPYLNNSNKSMLSGLGGDTLTIYASESGGATSKHDLTKMFFSPTADVMQHKRMRSTGYLTGSTSNLSMFGTPQNGGGSQVGGSVSNLGRNIPSMYINNEGNNSEYSMQTGQTGQPGAVQGTPTQGQPRSTRKTIPSMYLEDLMDSESR